MVLGGGMRPKPIPLFQVDAFTTAPFTGNPAAVCLLEEPLADRTMQGIAAEMNLSETAFLLPEGEGYRLRWFTPTVEVDLCGHATLATAHVLFQEGRLRPVDTARFFTRSGELRARWINSWIELDFPLHPVTATPAPELLVRSLGIAPRFCGTSAGNYLFELEDEGILRSLAPDFSLMARHAPHGVIVSSRTSSPDFDFISRFFAPGIGIPEDPVTGSAHCSLGPFWAEKLKKSDLTAYQASPRGGVLKLRVGKERVDIAGQAVTVLEGRFLMGVRDRDGGGGQRSSDRGSEK